MLFPSVLAGLVGFLMVTLTFYISTIQKIPLYASMKAIGAANFELVFLLLVQVASVFILGSALAAGCLWAMLIALRTTTVAVEITPRLVLVGTGALFLSSVLGALLSVRRVATTDPGKAFRT
jgi:putative ABC transport system permease protein